MQISEPLGEKDRIFGGFEKSRNELACFMGREDSSSLNCLEILLYFPSQDFILPN